MDSFDPVTLAADVERILRDVGPRLRKYASHWEWPDKRVKEQSIAQDLMNSLSQKRQAFFRDPISSSDDPPDVIATSLEEAKIGIEMCELVSRAAVEANQRGEAVYWDPDLPEAVAEIHRILATKDAKIYKGGPFGEIVLVVHTDESAIDVSQLERALQEHEFPRPRQITRGYVLFSYDPRLNTYPSIPLRFSEVTR